MGSLRARLNELYNGDSETARRFRYALLLFDILAISFFVAVSFLPMTPAIHVIDVVLGVIFLVEYVARFVITPRKLHFVFLPSSLADLIVIVSLLAPAVTENFAFLRVLRSLRLLRSYRVLKELRGRYGLLRTQRRSGAKYHQSSGLHLCRNRAGLRLAG